MKLTPDEKEKIILMYKPGSAINSLEKLEWDMVSLSEEEPDGGWSARFSSQAQEERLVKRAEYRGDLLNVEMIAFQKGVQAAIAWLEKYK